MIAIMSCTVPELPLYWIGCLKMPTKEAWGEPHISPERSLRSAPGSPLSPSTTQAWVDEESSIEQQMVGSITDTPFIDHHEYYV